MTNGIVSVVGEDGKTVLKIVAGADGQRAMELARRVAKARSLDADTVYGLATQVGFGSVDCLVVLTSAGEVYQGTDELDRRYRTTFDDPRFNPRWDNGTAAHVVLIHLPDFDVREE